MAIPEDRGVKEKEAEKVGKYQTLARELRRMWEVKTKVAPIDQFRYIKIQPQTIDLSTRLWGINTEFVGFIPQSLVLKSIV